MSHHSLVESYLTLCDPMNCNPPGSSVLHCLLRKFISVESVMLSNPLILSLLLPSAFPSIRVFSHESALHIRWPKYWSFSINPSNEYSGLISFRIDWFDLPAVQGTLESFSAPQSESISSSVLSLLCVTILTSVQDYWKTIALIIWTFVDKMMSLLFNTV